MISLFDRCVVCSDLFLNEYKFKLNICQSCFGEQQEWIDLELSDREETKKYFPTLSKYIFN